MIIIAKNNYSTGAHYSIDGSYGTTEERAVTLLRGLYAGLDETQYKTLFVTTNQLCERKGLHFKDFDLVYIIDGERVTEEKFNKA